MAEAERTLIINVATLDEVKARTMIAATSGKFGGHVRSFASLELLWKVFSPKRIDIMKAMAGQAPMSIREAARRVRRDVKAVHGDVQALMERNLIDRTDDGKIVFPYDEIHLDVVLKPLEASAA